MLHFNPSFMIGTVEKLSIKDWAEADRPREKLLAKGKGALSDTELIAIIIGTGSPEESAVEVSRKILGSAGNDLQELGRLSVKDFLKFKGIGEAKAISIVAALELGRRRREAAGLKKEQINTSKDAVEIFQPHMADLQHEEFWVLYLNRANGIIKKQHISSGGVTGTVVDARIIFKHALDCLASSIILCHNHPSGNRQPSESDIKLTKKLKEGGNLIEVAVLDHIIISEKSFYSFADEGII